MPRPPVKRSKLNGSNQVAKRVANNPLSISPAARRRQLQEHLAHKDLGSVPNDSDDSDLLVTRSRTTRNRRNIARQEIYGSGGVGQGDKVAAHKSPSNKRQRLSPNETPQPESGVNGTRRNATLKSSNLKRTDRLSTSQAGRPSSTVPKSARPSPLGLKSALSPRGRSQETPTAEASILGPIKTRKRQPSILRLIDAPDSPILDQDFKDFLPETESTPLNASRKRKRKLSSPAAIPSQLQPQEEVLEAGNENTPNTEPDLPPPPLSRALSQKQQPFSERNSDTMAPPRSSSSAPSPTRPKSPSPTKNRANIRKPKQPKSLSTTALQALMPARRQQRTRRDRAAKATSEFDIPEDSSDPSNDATQNQGADSTAEGSYINSPKPTKRSKKASQPAKLQKRKPPSISRKSNPKPRGQEGGSRNSKARKASTQSPSKTRATSAAKSSSQQQQQHQHSLTKTTKPISDSSRRADKVVVEEEDKENRPSASSGAYSKRAQARGRAQAQEPGGESPSFAQQAADTADTATATAAAAADEEADDNEGTNLSIEVGRSYEHPRAHHDTEPPLRGGGQSRLAQEFKEVDEWELEFEDVTMDGEGSDPLAR